MPGIRHLVLVGLMGTGKTTTGTRLAERLGWPMRDSDAEIEREEGRSVRELRDALGTDAMHELEAGVLLRALDGPGPDVVCGAASVVDSERCREALRGDGVAVVWLTARPATAAARFRTGSHRPWYGDDPVAFLTAQERERGPLFRSLDPLTVATDDRPPDAVAGTILHALSLD